VSNGSDYDLQPQRLVVSPRAFLSAPRDSVAALPKSSSGRVQSWESESKSTHLRCTCTLALHDLFGLVWFGLVWFHERNQMKWHNNNGAGAQLFVLQSSSFMAQQSIPRVFRFSNGG
jgi:hypothetical protein